MPVKFSMLVLAFCWGSVFARRSGGSSGCAGGGLRGVPHIVHSCNSAVLAYVHVLHVHSPPSSTSSATLLLASDSISATAASSLFSDSSAAFTTRACAASTSDIV
jgi:hypothetical protein